ncbi:MAG: hypothetical protein NTX72_00985 [Candidatus Uhrbacteria bacterium]|nr:hypothetical protein [Candidatus Uhrbacteria bacterium]
MTGANWFFLVRQLVGYAHELQNPKDIYVQQKLSVFLRDRTSCFRSAELLSSDQLLPDGHEGFRIHVSVDALDDQYFEFLRKRDGTYAFRSAVAFPKLTFEAAFDFENMTEQTKMLLEYDFNRGLERLLVA